MKTKKKATTKSKLINKPNVIAFVSVAVALFIFAVYFWDISKHPSVVHAADDFKINSLKALVYKSPTCGCCGKWIEHMEGAGFEVTVNHPQELNAVKDKYGIDAHLQSCHTAVINGYVFEGHIPADVIRTFLSEKSDAIGLTVPGMPVGSPGMEVGMRKDSFDIILMKRNGETSIYASR